MKRLSIIIPGYLFTLFIATLPSSLLLSIFVAITGFTFFTLKAITTNNQPKQLE